MCETAWRVPQMPEIPELQAVNRSQMKARRCYLPSPLPITTIVLSLNGAK